MKTVDDRINCVKNSVGPGFGPIYEGKNNVLHTLETSVYRVTGMNQIQDIIDCGYVRPKGYGSRRERVGDIVYWSSGNSKLHYVDKRPVLEAPATKVLNGQIGAISIDDLSAIWLYDEQQNKYVNRLQEIKKLHIEKKQSTTSVPLEQLKPLLNDYDIEWADSEEIKGKGR